MPRQTDSGRLFSSILCPVDFSTNSRTALRYASRLARGSGASLVVLYVDDPLLAVVAAKRTQARAVMSAGARDLRQFVASNVGASDDLPVTLVTSAGKPPQEIVKAAEQHGCDLIVMGYRGLGKASRFFLGSTTEGVVRMTSVPILAIPPARRPARRASGRSNGAVRRKRIS